MNGIVGFTLQSALAPERRERIRTRHDDALDPHSGMVRTTLTVGLADLELWGRGDVTSRLHHAPDGSVLALVGSPHGRVDWTDVPEPVRTGTRRDCQMPWDGRIVLLRVSADGRHWTVWTDWAGSLPVFLAAHAGGRILTTLEPVAAGAVPAGADGIYLPGLLSLLINGHIVGNRTLLKAVDVVPADSVVTWDDAGRMTRRLWTVAPTESHADAGWCDLVDEMFERSRAAIADTVGQEPRWVLPLSGGLDSRLLASVAADLGADVHAYAWGTGDSTDVVFSRQVARVLGLRWTHVELGNDYLVRYTRRWASLFGAALHFHGMYQMAFLDAIEGGPPGPILTGFLGDVLSANPLFQSAASRHQLYDEWLTHWPPGELESLFRFPIAEPLEEMVSLYENQRQVPVSVFKAHVLAEIRSRQRIFTAFQSTLSDYWRGVGTPFLSRQYARFCLSLPRAALDGRRVLADVYRRHYARVACVPGTYGDEPHIRTGRYLLLRRVAQALPERLRMGPLRGFRTSEPRMDMAGVHAHGWDALWPIPEARARLADWMDLSKLDDTFAAVMADRACRDMRPLRKLQSVQAFAYRLLYG